jgi:hypothetical protein
MQFRQTRALNLTALCIALAAAASCVSQRPARNGVFNENQYLRKSFLIRSGDSGQPDPGWMMRVTVTQVSTPNPLGGDIFLTPGFESGGGLVRFVVAQDKLQLVNMREITADPSDERTPEIVNAWPATNVDIKYRVNLDGEITNFLEENQELNWQDRQWVKLNLAKNDMSDVAPLGSYMTELLGQCTDVSNYSSTLVTDSFRPDEKNDYIEWAVSITAPVKWNDPACLQAYGGLGVEAAQFGRQDVTFTLVYSFKRALPADKLTYQPMTVAEKDPIRHKYGFFDWIIMNRDPDSGLLGAQQYVQRFDPQKPIVWYFAPQFPDNYKQFFLGQGGVKDQTNQLLSDAGAAARVDFREHNDPRDLPTGDTDRHYGDLRYNFLVWMTDRDTQNGFAGLTQFTTDPRTGEIMSASILMNDFAIKDYYVQRLDAFLKSMGASLDVNSSDPWPDPSGTCQDGDTMPIVPDTLLRVHNGNSSVYQKMQQYLQKPVETFGPLGPPDFTIKQDDDFFRAYYAIIPYQVFADPDSNPFVIREGGAGVYGPTGFWQKLQKEAAFQQAAANIDKGLQPYDAVSGPDGVRNAVNFLNDFRQLTIAHKDYLHAKHFVHRGLGMRLDAPGAFSFEQIAARDARHCRNGRWETKEEWVDNLISTYWSQVAWHEFGHSLGLMHNFMASVDKPNFPHYTDGAGRDHTALFASSVMEYNAAPDRVFWSPGWGPYDQGAISFIYANTKPSGDAGLSISGQVSATQPWKDPHGFTPDGTEIQYLFCNEYHLLYTPLCRQGDMGTTPSEITANEIERYEWEYAWNNFRQYRKFWDNSLYANVPASTVVDMRRFMSLWVFDWGSSELVDTFRRIGVTNPNPDGSALEYYSQLSDKFNAEMSAAGQMIGAFHKAIIQQSSGERPFQTIYDKYYGDTTQQGIILDKLFAMQGWVALWPTDNYDQNQAGAYISSYSSLGDASYAYIAEDAVTSMVGGQYDVYPYFVPLAVAQFAQDTHSPAFFGRIDVRDWIGGHVFYRVRDFTDFFRDLAAQNNYPGCPTFDAPTCTFDPRAPGVSDSHNEFRGPDNRVWIWAYIADRNQWVAAQKDRNTATYIIIRNYTDDVINQQDDGNFPGGAYGLQLPMKFFLDSFDMFN